MMKNIKYLNLRIILTFIFLGGLTIACQDDEPIFDNSLKVLSQKINGTEISNGVTDVSKELSVELIFTHTLNPSVLESALTFTGANGAIDFNIAYSNTNSTITITPNVSLEFAGNYTISLSAGTYGNEGETLQEDFSLNFSTATLTLTLSSDVASIGEADEVATITATLSGILDVDVNLDLNFGGSATLSTDFTASNTSITIPAGETTASLTLTAAQDMTIEGTESIEISVSELINAQEFTFDLSIDLIDDDIDSNGDGITDRGFIINEVLFDPPSDNSGTPEVEGDANGDGTRSPSEDEFIEFINDSDQPVDLSGFTLFDANNLAQNNPRHTFPAGTIVPPGGVYILFGGGNPRGDFGTAQVAVSTTGNMNLTNSDDVITILDVQGNVFLTFDTQVEGAGLNFGANQSITRSPDINGAYTLHLDVNADLEFSPGKQANGANFGENAPPPRPTLIINEVLFDPPSDDSGTPEVEGDANGDGSRSALGDEFIEFINISEQAVDISGYTVFDKTNFENNTPRHTFPPGTIIPAGGVYILFGSGSPTGDFGGAMVDIASSGSINLTNSGDIITVLDDQGNVFLTFDTDVDGMGLDFGDNQSITRSPDIDGSFTLHTSANPSLVYSPGTKVDGTNF